ncbi:eukaryotic-like serine/threonine-protein kinase [Phycisphaerales bacterium]|nr:eukaryotic-like serine/threonine-protein kinase [Phycisphaerales bacterium]
MSTRVTRLAEEVFLEVAELPAHQRPQALDRLCGSDAELRRVVESLLGFHAGAEDFLERPEFLTQVQAGARRTDEEEADALIPGTRVGEYTVRGMLGSGGMGSVYVAEQERPRRTVALKVIRRGYATPSLLRRFEHEAEVLGKLQHPGIAQIYEAGASEIEPGEPPQPYIAMELVRGPTLSAFATQNDLSLPAKLDLIARVCDAVHHAHQRGVIHRDLKPQNILVDERGQPKILDFGVARAADSDLRVTTLQTSVGQLIGTLPYMSPEQVLADPGEVDNRSDVYALGVIMYQVLTGRLPLDVSSRSIPEAARVIRDQTPARLSSVSKIYRGDIETIVSKSLDKDKARRYQSAAELASDIRRYLTGDPIAAKVDSSLYVLKKQLKRYRGVVIAAGVFILAVAGFAVHATMQWRTNAGLVRTGEAQSERLRRNLYLSDIGYAQAALAVNDVERVRRVLEGCPPDLRGWEWAYLARASDDTSILVSESGDVAIPIALTGDCRSAVICTNDGIVRVVDAKTGEERFTVRNDAAAAARPSEVVSSNDGKSLLVGWSDNRVTRVDLASGQAAAFFPNERSSIAPLRVWAFSPDDRAVLAWLPGESAVAVVDSADGAVRARISAPGAVTGCVGSEGRTVIVGFRGGMLREFEIESGLVLGEFAGHSGEIRDVKAGPAGRFASAGSDQSVRVWDSDGSCITLTDFESRVNGVAWSADGSMIAAGGTDRVLRVFDATTGRLVRRLGGHTGPLRSVRFAPDARYLVSTGFDRTVRWWADYASPREMTATLDNAAVWAGTVSPDGARVILSDSTRRVRAFDMRNLAEIATFPGEKPMVNVLRMSPDGRVVGAGGMDGDLCLRDATTGAVVLDFADHPRAMERRTNRVNDLAFTPDSRRLISASADSNVRVWDTTSGALLSTFTGSGVATAAAVSGDGGLLAAAWSRDSIVRVWKLPSGELLHSLEGQPRYSNSLAFSRDGQRLISPSDDSNIYVWNLRSPDTPPKALRGHRGGVYRVSVSPDGKRLASGGFDGRIRVWDLESGGELLNLRGFIGAVSFVSFTPDGSRIIAATTDGEVKVWDARPK